jgi:hypothetical protein
VKRALKRFAQSIGRFVVLVHLGPRLGSSGARVIGADPIEDWERRKREAEEVDRKHARELDDLD